ncbi:MAG TPA: ABC transporter ATP-binding protein [Burkholderiales bacterium]|nr:ABC transporter ATP-binding protein [Burkholderiales bacterium]
MPQQEPQVTVSARGLSRRFGQRIAVHPFDLELRRGEIVGFLGPNGAGKTTTMQMLTGNLAPSTGRIEICGVDLLERPTAAKARLGYLPETPPLYREMSVERYLGFCGRLRGLHGAALQAAVREACRRCGLAEAAARLIGALSKGYQQRVGIAQAVIHQPDVVILDEPTVGLDPNQVREIRTLIRELRGNQSVILSSHILPEVEALCDRVELMHEGRLVYSDTLTGVGSSGQERTLTVEFLAPPAAAELERLPGVTRVQALADRGFRLHWSGDADPGPALAEEAARRGWGLARLAPGRVTLEEVFVSLTGNDGQDVGSGA